MSMESLLKAHHPFLVRLAGSLVRDSHLADDMVQEVAKRALAASRSAGPDAAAIERTSCSSWRLAELTTVRYRQSRSLR